MKTCPTCQHTYSDDVEFCPRDGARLGGEPREERECPYCAERILKKARVCKHCGRDVEPLAKADIAVQAPLPAPLERIGEPPAAQPQRSQPVAAPSRPLAAAKPLHFEMISEPPGKMTFITIAVVAPIALILIVAGVWYFSQPGPKKGEVSVNPKDGLKYVWIPAGTFMMGCSPGDDECYDFEKPPHQVTITKGFWMGQTEVTVRAYKRFVGATGKQMPPEPNIGERPLNPGWGDDAMPIVGVSWDEAQAYCGWAGGRLPTEAEWEYTARGGSTEARYGPIDEVAWYADNSGQQRLDSTQIRNEDQRKYSQRRKDNGNGMHEAGSKQANGFGVFDMLGNVSEWVSDWYDGHYYQSSPPQDPAGPAGGQERILRGGSWDDVPRVVRVSFRFRVGSSFTGYDSGFRCGGEAGNP